MGHSSEDCQSWVPRPFVDRPRRAWRQGQSSIVCRHGAQNQSEPSRGETTEEPGRKSGHAVAHASAGASLNDQSPSGCIFWGARCAPGLGASGWGLEIGGWGSGLGAGVVFRGWHEDSDRVSVGVVCLVVKDQVGRLLTGVGGDGSAEDWMVLRSLGHHIGWLRNLWLGRLRNRRRRGFCGWRCLDGLRLRLGLPLLL